MKSLKLILGASSVMLACAAGAREIYVNVDFCDEVRWNWARTGRGYAPQDVTNLLRVALTGRQNAPDIWEISHVLGEEETRRRLTAYRDA